MVLICFSWSSVTPPRARPLTRSPTTLASSGFALEMSYSMTPLSASAAAISGAGSASSSLAMVRIRSLLNGLRLPRSTSDT